MKNKEINSLLGLLNRAKHGVASVDGSFKIAMTIANLIEAAEKVDSKIKTLIKADGATVKEGNIDLSDDAGKRFKEHYDMLMDEDCKVEMFRIGEDDYKAVFLTQDYTAGESAVAMRYILQR